MYNCRQMHEDDIIHTPIFRSNPGFINWRAQRIREALAFHGGTAERPKKHVIASLRIGEAYFNKPGKEAARQNPNIHDMAIHIDNAGVSHYTFEDIWEHLVKIAIINQILFKKVLVLLYRLCFFVDHRQSDNGEIRYLPSKALSDYSEKIDFAIAEGFRDKFKTESIGLSEYLHFIDMLGWNEDVKYHVRDGEPDFGDSDKRNVGRPNTIISAISVPLMINDFLSNIIENVNYVEKINVRLILSTMQQLSKSRGVCVLSHTKLREYLSPYLTEAR